MFSFHFIPSEDRLAISFPEREEGVPEPVLLTRRLVKLLGNYLRQYIEKNTSLPETVNAEDVDDVFRFMHHSELENNPPKWSSEKAGEKKQINLQDSSLASKVDINSTEKNIKLMFKKEDIHLVSLTLGWREIHRFLYSLAEMSKKADWNLEGVFEWSGQAWGPLEMEKKH